MWPQFPTSGLGDNFLDDIARGVIAKRRAFQAQILVLDAIGIVMHTPRDVPESRFL